VTAGDVAKHQRVSAAEQGDGVWAQKKEQEGRAEVHVGVGEGSAEHLVLSGLPGATAAAAVLNGGQDHHQRQQQQQQEDNGGSSSSLGAEAAESIKAELARRVGQQNGSRGSRPAGSGSGSSSVSQQRVAINGKAAAEVASEGVSSGLIRAGEVAGQGALMDLGRGADLVGAVGT
jgi:hypothetical protein